MEVGWCYRINEGAGRRGRSGDGGNRSLEGVAGSERLRELVCGRETEQVRDQSVFTCFINQQTSRGVKCCCFHRFLFGL